MLSLYAYIFVSFAVTIAFVVDYASVYDEFFTLVVQLTNSPVFHLLCVNNFVASLWILWFVARFTFFGSLSRTESDAVQSATLVYVMEFLVCPLYFGVPILSSAGVVSLVTVVVAVLHRLARERVQTLQMTEDRTIRTGMIIRLLFFLHVFCMVDLYIVFDMIGTTEKSGGEQLSMQYCIALLYVHFLISILKSFTQLFFSVTTRETTYNSLAFYMEMLFSMSSNVVFFISFVYVAISSFAPVPLIRMFIQNIMKFGKNVQLLRRYRKLKGLLREIPNATEEVLSKDPHCAICYDDMSTSQACKQLPCGHCYHEVCLLRWFEKMSTCPYCRSDIAQRTNAMTAYAAAREATTNVATEQTPQEALEVVTATDDMPVVPEEEIRRAYEEYRAKLELQLPKSEVDTAKVLPSPALRESTLKASSGSAVKATDFVVSASKDAERLAAYEEYTAAVKVATEKLEKRLRIVDAS